MNITAQEKKKDSGVNILDKNEEDEWVSVSEISGAGSEISKVIISPMGNTNENNVIVVYQNIASAEKSLEIYRYKTTSLKCRLG